MLPALYLYSLHLLVVIKRLLQYRGKLKEVANHQWLMIHIKVKGVFGFVLLPEVAVEDVVIGARLLDLRIAPLDLSYFNSSVLNLQSGRLT